MVNRVGRPLPTRPGELAHAPPGDARSVAFTLPTADWRLHSTPTRSWCAAVRTERHVRPLTASEFPRMSDPNDEPAHPSEDRQQADELLPVLYAELRRLAASLSVRLKPGQTLQPTALVHEAYLQLAKNEAGGWDGRRHFFGAAALAMRNILVDQARARGAQKRGGDRDRVALVDGVAYIEPPADDLLALDAALQKLQAEKPHLAELVMLRYYSGLSVQEAAEVLGRSESTLTREWRFARAWLARELGAAPGE